MSEEANITEAQSEGSESGPSSEIISLNDASAPLPEKGRIKSIVAISDGRPKKSNSGRIRRASASVAPEAESIEMATTRAHIVGIRRTALKPPSRAPLKKCEK